MEQPFRANWNARKRLWNHLLGHAIPKKYRLKSEGRTGGRNLQIRKAILRSLREKGCGQSVGEVAFGTWGARLIAAPLNQQATKASALPIRAKLFGGPNKVGRKGEMTCSLLQLSRLPIPRSPFERSSLGAPILSALGLRSPQKSEIFGGPDRGIRKVGMTCSSTA